MNQRLTDRKEFSCGCKDIYLEQLFPFTEQGERYPRSRILIHATTVNNDAFN